MTNTSNHHQHPTVVAAPYEDASYGGMIPSHLDSNSCSSQSNTTTTTSEDDSSWNASASASASAASNSNDNNADNADLSDYRNRRNRRLSALKAGRLERRERFQRSLSKEVLGGSSSLLCVEDHPYYLAQQEQKLLAFKNNDNGQQPSQQLNTTTATKTTEAMRDELLAAYQLIHRQRIRIQQLENHLNVKGEQTGQERGLNMVIPFNNNTENAEYSNDDDVKSRRIRELQDQLVTLHHDRARELFQIQNRMTHDTMKLEEHIVLLQTKAEYWQIRGQNAAEIHRSQMEQAKDRIQELEKAATAATATAVLANEDSMVANRNCDLCCGGDDEIMLHAIESESSMTASASNCGDETDSDNTIGSSLTHHSDCSQASSLQQNQQSFNDNDKECNTHCCDSTRASNVELATNNDGACNKREEAKNSSFFNHSTISFIGKAAGRLFTVKR